MASERDIEIVRGENSAVTWQLLESESPDTLFDITGQTFFLGVKLRGALIIEKSSVDDGLTVDTETSKVEWVPEIDETYLFPEILPGKDKPENYARYELERRIGGTQRRVAYGYMIGRGGVVGDG